MIPSSLDSSRATYHTRSAKDACVSSLLESFTHAPCLEQPYRHWFLDHCLPESVVDGVLDLPFAAPALGGVSGKREIHNATRTYFDVENRSKFEVCEDFCRAFHDDRVTAAIAARFGAKLEGTYLRVEYAQDTDGFWLEPHTDLGVKAFTMLLYLSKDPRHDTLGTDIYDSAKQPVGRSPFQSNTAMVFIPSSITYHGFTPRTIEGVRKSVIINYVTAEWRDREQLAYPDQPIRV
jgi:hypothetical protein